MTKLNDGHYLEVMDRLHVLMSTMDDHLFQHPVVKQNKELREHLIKGVVNLIKAYQEAGALASKKTRTKKKKK